MSQSYVVIAPYVTLKLTLDDGTVGILGFYEGAGVPPNVEPESLERHIQKGMVAKVGSPEAKFSGPAGTPKPGEPPNVPVTESPVVSRPLAERQKAQAEAADATKAKADAARAAAKAKTASEAKTATAAEAKTAADAKSAEETRAAEAAERAAGRAAAAKADS
jgi:hypothetical protein